MLDIFIFHIVQGYSLDLYGKSQNGNHLIEPWKLRWHVMEEAVLHIILFTLEHSLQKLSIHQALEHIATKTSL